jgi:uncharacterized protein YbaR (Trm112 family)
MTIELECPNCAGPLTFDSKRVPTAAGHLVGSCRSCRSVFSLHGGRIAPIDVLAPGQTPIR